MKKTKNQPKTLFITAEQDGYTIITNNICRNTFISDSAKALYIYLKSHSHNFNLSYESIANYLHKSVKSIQRTIKELKDNGFLKLVKKENSNTYYYELLNTPKKEQLKEYTKDNILNAYYSNIINDNDLLSLNTIL